jgi:hypothetical protein
MIDQFLIKSGVVLKHGTYTYIFFSFYKILIWAGIMKTVSFLSLLYRATGGIEAQRMELLEQGSVRAAISPEPSSVLGAIDESRGTTACDETVS